MGLLQVYLHQIDPKLLQALIDKKTRPHDISKPGHVFPLIAKEGGVLRRTGHTEAAVDLARIAGFEPAARHR